MINASQFLKVTTSGKFQILVHALWLHFEQIMMCSLFRSAQQAQFTHVPVCLHCSTCIFIRQKNWSDHLIKNKI